MKNSFFLTPWLVIISTISGCSLLIGNVKPIEEKAKDYYILNLAEKNPDWTNISAKAEPNESGISDMAFQAKETSSIISINSACKHYSGGVQPENRKALTKELLLGISDISLSEEKEIEVANDSGLETTTQGKINSEAVKIRTVVLQRNSCVYDLMYIARPEHFDKHVSDFSAFVSSLRLK